MNRLKNITILFFALTILTFNNYYNVYAGKYYTEKEDYYIETTIISDNMHSSISIKSLSDKDLNLVPMRFLSINKTNKTITKTKTCKIRSKNGTVLWSVSIKATFTYNGTTSKCISYSHSASAPAKSWSIKSVSSSKKGNSATAVGVAIHFDNVGSKDFRQSITIKCNKNGVVS